MSRLTHILLNKSRIVVRPSLVIIYFKKRMVVSGTKRQSFSGASLPIVMDTRGAVVLSDANHYCCFVTDVWQQKIHAKFEKH